MRKITIFMVLLMLSFSATAQWTDMFNGKNLRGWKVLNGTAKYYVENGELVGVSKLDSPNSFLTNGKVYGDFILEFEFKFDDLLNTGVQFRSLSTPDYRDGRVHGYQFEMDPSERAWTGGVYDEARRGWLYPMTYNPSSQTAYKRGEWNKARIEAIGNSIKCYVNDIPCANLLDDMTSEGIIAFQVHKVSREEQVGKEVRWRNIRICTENLEQEVMKPAVPSREVSTIDNVLSSDDIKDGWELLWDGKTTNGWRGAKLDEFPTKGWVIEDGTLQVLSNGGDKSRNGGDIVTERKFKNFELKVDFMLTEGANGGIKYFITEDESGKTSTVGCEFQVLDDEKHPDAKMGVAGNRTTGSLYDLITASADKKVNMKGYNTAHIIVKDNHVEHWLNGVKVVEYDRNCQMFDALVAYSKFSDKASYFAKCTEGRILLQDHSDHVIFKNIIIKELP